MGGRERNRGQGKEGKRRLEEQKRSHEGNKKMVASRKEEKKKESGQREESEKVETLRPAKEGEVEGRRRENGEKKLKGRVIGACY